MWLGANVVEMWHMGIAEGRGEEDLTSIIQMIEKWAGVVVGGNERAGETMSVSRPGNVGRPTKGANPRSLSGVPAGPAGAGEFIASARSTRHRRCAGS